MLKLTIFPHSQILIKSNIKPIKIISTRTKLKNEPRKPTGKIETFSKKRTQCLLRIVTSIRSNSWMMPAISAFHSFYLLWLISALDIPKFAFYLPLILFWLIIGDWEEKMDMQGVRQAWETSEGCCFFYRFWKRERKLMDKGNGK